MIYVTDALMAIAENTTHLIGQGGVVDYGKTINKRWIEVLTTSQKEPEQKESEQPEDNRPSEEIAEDIWKRIRGH